MALRVQQFRPEAASFLYILYSLSNALEQSRQPVWIRSDRPRRVPLGFVREAAWARVGERAARMVLLQEI